MSPPTSFPTGADASRGGALAHEARRFRLVRAVDEVLARLREHAELALDLGEETANLDEYLEIRPERRAEIAAHVGSGRLAIGPWFVKPDELLASSEALARNLRLGAETVAAFGGARVEATTAAVSGSTPGSMQLRTDFGLSGGADSPSGDSSGSPAGSWSARIDRKALNHEVQGLLEKHAEPLAAATGPVLGRELAGFLDRAWRELLTTHAQRDLAGLGVDAVEEESRQHLDCARAIAEEIVRDALATLARRTGFERADGVEVIAVHNPHFEPWTGTAACVVAWPDALSDDDLDALALVDSDGKPVRVQIEPTPSELDAVGGLLLHVEFAAKAPPCGLAFYRLVRGASGPQGFDDVVAGGVIENEQLRVETRHDGSLAVLHKASGRRFDGALTFESRADVGDLARFVADASKDPAWSTGKANARVQAWRSANAALLSISILWKLPWVAAKERERLALRVETIVRLEDGTARLEFETVLDTELVDHRLRVLLPLPPDTNALTRDRPFAHVIGERAADSTQFSSTFVHAAAVDGDAGTAVLVAHRGLHEHAIVDAPANSPLKGAFLALTLWRGVGSTPHDAEGLAASLPTPDAQRPPLGLVLRFAWGALPAAESVANVAARAATFAHPPLVQHVELSQDARSLAAKASARRSFLRCDDPRIALSCLRVEASGRVVVRLWNRSSETVRATLQLGPDLAQPHPPRSARRVRFDGTDLGSIELVGTIARVELGPAAVQTIHFEFEANP